MLLHETKYELQLSFAMPHEVSCPFSKKHFPLTCDANCSGLNHVNGSKLSL